MKQLAKKGRKSVRRNRAPKDKSGRKSMQTTGQDVVIDQDDLSGECARQARLYLDYVKLYAKSASVVRGLRLKLDVIESTISTRVRERLERDGICATERVKFVTLEMRKTVEWQQAKAALNTALYEEDLLKGAVESMSQRKDMLVQLGSREREEMRQHITIMERETRDKITPIK